MAFVDSPHYAWIMAYLWGMKNFLVSLGTAQVSSPKLRPTLRTYYEAFNDIDHYQPVFNGLNGPYLLIGLIFNNVLYGTPQWFWGNHVKIWCDGELVYETANHIFDTDATRYVGRDGEWAPLFFAQEEMLIETQPRWTGDSSGEIECTIMRFAE